MDLADQRHPAGVLQVPFKLSVDMRSPRSQVSVRIVFEPLVFAGNEEGHATLAIECPMVESDAQTTDVCVPRWEEPLAQIWKGAVGAHEVEGVFGEVVVDPFIA